MSVKVGYVVWEEQKNLHPVRGRGETNTVGTVLEGEDFGAVDPRCGCPGQAINADEDVRGGNYTLGRGTQDFPSQVGVSVNGVNRMSVGSHETSNGEV